jgi:hypothetical protein
MTTITLVNGWKEKYQHFNLIPHTQIVRKNPVKTESCMKGCVNIKNCKQPFCRQILEKRREIVISWLGFTLNIITIDHEIEKINQ